MRFPREWNSIGISSGLCGLLTAFVLTSFPLVSLPSQEARENKSNQSSNADLESGISLAQKGDLKGAEEAFQRAVTAHPRDPRALTALGQVLDQLGEVPESIKEFRKVITIDPNSPDAHVNLGIALADQADLAGALKESSNALRLAPSSASAHFLRGRLLADLGRREEARSEFKKVLAIAPGFAEALRFWALLEGDEGNASLRVDLLRRYVQLRPDDATAFIQLGDGYDEEGKSKDAIAAWRRAIALNPLYQKAIYSLARALRQSNPEESKRLISRLAELEHDRQTVDRVKLLGNQANAKMTDGNYKGAIDDLGQAIVLCGNCELLGALTKNLGLAYCHAGQLNAGERELKLAETLIPEDSSVITALGVIQQQRRGADDTHPLPRSNQGPSGVK